MVMVGLSLLGLGFVAISETEGFISLNDRNHAQTLASAEAGAKVVVEWYQNPRWARTVSIGDGFALLPGNVAVFKRDRILNGVNIGKYKPNAEEELLFDKPYNLAPGDRLYGDEDHPDVAIASYGTFRTSAGTAFLEKLNAQIFSSSPAAEITEIRVFAPPVMNGTLLAGFWTGGVRYGVATISVTATRFDDARSSTRQVAAQRTVRLVLAAWPVPHPQGSLQSNGTLSGEVQVHWGKMTSSSTMSISHPWLSIPWVNAWDRLSFERGYDDAMYPIGASFPDNADWLAEVIERTYQDPWFEARSRGSITNVGGTDPVPYRLTGTSNVITAPGTAGYSNWAQHQSFSNRPGYKEVQFPRFDYDFWKEIAVQGSASGQENVFYLWPCRARDGCSPVGPDSYTDGTTVKSFGRWINVLRSLQPARPGFYFFDTDNRLNPQGPGASGTLAPALALDSSDDENCCRMDGFIYLNVEEFRTGPLNPPELATGTPGEPFRDIGYREAAGSGTAWSGVMNAGAADGMWSYQDTNGNGEFDIVVKRTSKTRPVDGSVVKTGGSDPWLPVEWFPGCVVGKNCSEPHEPFLNIIYSPTEPMNQRVGWDDPDRETRVPKAIKANGVSPNCASPADYRFCTSNGYDSSGGTVTNLRPILNGVLYIEGQFAVEGRADYFGSVIAQGGVQGSGTADIWFDETLIKGTWPPSTMHFPNVYISSYNTEN